MRNSFLPLQVASVLLVHDRAGPSSNPFSFSHPTAKRQRAPTLCQARGRGGSSTVSPASPPHPVLRTLCPPSQDTYLLIMRQMIPTPLHLPLTCLNSFPDRDTHGRHTE